MTKQLQRYKYGYKEDEWGMNRSLGLIADPAGNVCLAADAIAAIEALRAEIAAPEPEPVFWWDGDTVGLQDCLDYKRTETYKHPLYREQPDTEALRKELEQIKEEQRLLHRGWFGHRGTGHLTFTEAVTKTMGELYEELDRVKGERDAMAARLNWIKRNLFGHKWNGVIDSGSQTNWDIWTGYRHVTAKMIGNTFGDAIDAARAAQGEGA